MSDLSEHLTFPSNSIIMAKARKALTGRWNKAALAMLALGGVFFVFMLLGAMLLPADSHKVSTHIIPNLVGNIFGAIMAMGVASFSLKIVRDGEVSFASLFTGFNMSPGKTILVGLISSVVMFIGLLLLIIPGFIVYYMLALVYYIRVDHPEMKTLDVLRKSRQMMMGHKWQLACLGFRFIGWQFLTIFTLGIGLLWLIPYTFTSSAVFYEQLRAHQTSYDNLPSIITT